MENNSRTNDSISNEVPQHQEGVFLVSEQTARYNIINNQQGQRSINGARQIQTVDGGEIVEFDENTKVAYHGESILVQTDSYLCYLNENHILGADESPEDDINRFEILMECSPDMQLEVNQQLFTDTGKIVATWVEESNDTTKPVFKIRVYDQIFTSSSEDILRLGNEGCELKFKNGKIYTKYRFVPEIKIYDTNGDSKEISLVGSKKTKSDARTIDSKGNIITGSEEEYIGENNDNYWKYSANQFSLNGKEYDLGDKKGKIVSANVSDNGKYVIIEYRLNIGNNQFEHQLLIGNQNGISSQKVLEGNIAIKTLKISDSGVIAYIDTKYKGVSVNDYFYPLPMGDLTNIIEFRFDGDRVILKAIIDFDTREYLIGLDPNAAEIVAQKEALKAKEINEQSMLEMLTNKEVNTPGKLQEKFDDADKVKGLEATLQELKQQLLQVKNLNEDLTKSLGEEKQKNKEIAQKFQELHEKLDKIVSGVSKGLIGYSITKEAGNEAIGK